MQCTQKVSHPDKPRVYEEVVETKCREVENQARGRLGSCGNVNIETKDDHSGDLCSGHEASKYQDAFDNDDLGYGF